MEQEENLSDKPFRSLSDVEEYAENTASSINYLVLESLGKASLQALHLPIRLYPTVEMKYIFSWVLAEHTEESS